MTKHALLLALAALPLAACSSIDSQIAELRSEEDELLAEIRTLTDERKAIAKLMAALQQLKQDDSARNEAEVNKARRELDAVRSR